MSKEILQKHILDRVDRMKIARKVGIVELERHHKAALFALNDLRRAIAKESREIVL